MYNIITDLGELTSLQSNWDILINEKDMSILGNE